MERGLVLVERLLAAYVKLDEVAPHRAPHKGLAAKPVVERELRTRSSRA